MSPYLLSIILGIIEGLTEFLPVSSTAHLRLAEALFHIDLGSDYWKTYTIVIQLGAVLCLPVYFRQRIVQFVSTFPRGDRGDRDVLTHPLSLTMIAFVVTAIPVFLLRKLIHSNLESLIVIGAALLTGGIIMWVVDVACRQPRTLHMEEMNLGQAVWIGAMQIFSAVFPGTSRSMSTIAAGQIAGMSRAAALEFSFFLSIPTMFAATGYDLLKAIVPHKAAEAGATAASLPLNSEQWTVLAIGFVVSFIVAFAAVAWFMHWVRRHGFIPFAVYRIILGIAVLWIALA